MKIIPVIFRYAYGKKECGPSLESVIILSTLKKLFDEVIPFFIEDHGFPDNPDDLQKKIIKFMDLNRPDFIYFIIMDDEIRKETLVYLKTKYITINWFLDDQWRFQYFSRNYAHLFSYILTTDKYSLKKYKEIGYSKAFHMQMATFDYTKDIDFSKVNYQYDISFVGGYNVSREWVVEELKKDGIHVECFGTGWKNGNVTFEQMKQIFLTSKINLNFSNSIQYDIRYMKYLLNSMIQFLLKFRFRQARKFLGHLHQLYLATQKKTNQIKDVEQIKARVFEIPGCGGFLLSIYSLEIEDNYHIGKEIAVFSNIEELKRQIKYYLNHENIREQMRLIAYKHTADYVYEKRFKEVFLKIFPEKQLKK